MHDKLVMSRPVGHIFNTITNASATCHPTAADHGRIPLGLCSMCALCSAFRLLRWAMFQIHRAPDAGGHAHEHNATA